MTDQSIDTSSLSPNSNQHILIVGTGYVGLVTGLRLAKLNHYVTCIDVDTNKINQLRNGKPPFDEPGVSDLLMEVISSGNIKFLNSFKQGYQQQKYIFFAVQTPQSPNGEANLTTLFDCLENAALEINSKAFFIIKSTVPVGTFDKINELPSIQGKRNITLVSCPEFIAEGNAINDFLRPSRIVIGSKFDQVNKEIGGLFYFYRA